MARGNNKRKISRDSEERFIAMQQPRRVSTFAPPADYHGGIGPQPTQINQWNAFVNRTARESTNAFLSSPNAAWNQPAFQPSSSTNRNAPTSQPSLYGVSTPQATPSNTVTSQPIQDKGAKTSTVKDNSQSSAYSSRARLRWVSSYGSGLPQAAQGPSSLSNAAHRADMQEYGQEWSSSTNLRRSKPIGFISAGTLKPEIPRYALLTEGPSNETSAAMTEDISAKLSIEDETRQLSSLTADQLAVKAPSEVDEAPVPEDLEFFVDTVGSAVAITLPQPRVRSPSPTSSSSSEEEILFQGRSGYMTIVDPVVDKLQQVSLSVGSPSSNHKSNFQLSKRPILQDEGPDDEAVADYLENIAANENDGNGANLTSFRTLSANDGNAIFLPSKEPEGTAASQSASRFRKSGGLGEIDLGDLNKYKVSKELTGPVEVILAKRRRKTTGFQYLVLYKGGIIQDAQWIPLTALERSPARRLISTFEDVLVQEALARRNNLNDDDEFSDADDFYDDTDENDDSSEDNKDVRQRRIDELDDEIIARLLSKQEELGMGSDELLLYTADDINKAAAEVNDAAADEIWGGHQTRYYGVPQQQRMSDRAMGKRPVGQYPSASLFADVLEQNPTKAYDIMNFEAPSLRKKSKGNQGLVPFGSGDAELEERMQKTWEKDRAKKRQRKIEREALRAEGLLGGAKGKKKSKAGPSTGPSRSRYARAGGVRYRDGDIVAAGVPELGAENRGRALLEKMGWSSGTALGAEHNKGPVDPIIHVVKNSRAGLG
ncbi:hypothetical protein M501DRAFT_997513 [Patellaria atrata CBS 101060]|uniref:G-patch domain-containing protein n=1 Tax=Patellaria atrata CBS 101060 TaxID=1346257 RepID=A0A9P4S468_9PEZI|nr:hypothetical protein M501DRAFT_997513 [Patellaria atrata CBS 101060]